MIKKLFCRAILGIGYLQTSCTAPLSSYCGALQWFYQQKMLGGIHRVSLQGLHPVQVADRKMSLCTLPIGGNSMQLMAYSDRNGPQQDSNPGLLGGVRHSTNRAITSLLKAHALFGRIRYSKSKKVCTPNSLKGFFISVWLVQPHCLDQTIG